MKRILVPIDFSEPAEHALEVAATIAKAQGGVIVVLHMLGLSEAMLTKNETYEYEEAKYYMDLPRKRFATFLDRPYLKNIKVQQIVQNFKIFKELNKVAQEQQIDLIVMGSYGASGLNEFFVGSNTEKVVRTADVPVLVVKTRHKHFKVHKILFACDFTDATILAFARVKAFAANLSAKLTLIYVNTPYDRFISTTEMEARISKFFYKAGTAQQEVVIFNDYNVEQGLMNYAKRDSFDILALPTRGKKPISHFLLGSRSIGEDMANHANMPVLTLKI